MDSKLGISKDCHQSFVESDKGNLFSPAIDIHPQSDITVSVEFNIKSCKSIKADSSEDKLKTCTPLLDLVYIQLDTLGDEGLFIEEGQSGSFFETRRVVTREDAVFTKLDTLSDKHDDEDGPLQYTTRLIKVNSIEGKVVFKLVDDGTCFTLKTFVVYRDFCPSFTHHLQYFPMTLVDDNGEGTHSVFGKCVSGASEDEDIAVSKMMCSTAGNWINSKEEVSKACLCDPGFSPNANQTACIPCKQNFYKQSRSMSHCVPCPRNSFSARTGSMGCACKDGFNRNDTASSCTKPISSSIA